MIARVETLGTAPAAAYRGTFAPAALAPAPGGELPAGWEGLYFPFDTPLNELRLDGSPARDGILPEVDLPRRMYAGEDTVFHSPLRFGEQVEQRASAGSLIEKEGRSGRLVFADVVREYRIGGALAIESTWHDVFLEAAAPGTPPAPPTLAPSEPFDWAETVTLDARQLFRFSAITFNTHRIHYDLEWAREAENLDDLLVHGPLLRILLLDAAVRHGSGNRLHRYAYRSHAPVLVNTPIELRGRGTGTGTELLAVGAQGELLARGTIETETP